MIRVLVADRNIRLLESISLTFAPRYHIHTASTRHRCAGFLQKTTFDLVIIGEKLADGPGLPLLGQVAQARSVPKQRNPSTRTRRWSPLHVFV
jgi:DNA-binding NtrC family response regulator